MGDDFRGTSIVVPCFNEQDNVPSLVRRIDEAMASHRLGYQLVLVDDGSTDQTWERILESAANNQSVLPLKLPVNQGMFAAWKFGLENASAGFSVLIDADLQNPPEAIPSLLEDLDRSGSDLSQGVRSSIAWLKDARYFSSRGLNWLLNLIFRDNARDHKSGFVAARTKTLRLILDYGQGYHFPQTFIRASALRLGLKVSEVETLFVAREAGKSFLSSYPAFHVYLRVLLDFPKAMRELARTSSKHRFLSEVPSPDLPLNRSEASPRYAFYFASMPLHTWMLRGQPTRQILERLRESQWYSGEQLREIREMRLSKLLAHAYASTEHYRRSMESVDFLPHHVQTLEDLSRVPLLSKEDVRRNLHMAMFSDSHQKNKMLRIQTSGSTGTPSITYADQDQLEVRFATTLRSLEWTGWRFGEKQLRLWHQKLGMTRSQAFRERLDARLLRREFVPAFEMSVDSLETLRNKIDSVRPFLIDGYAESLNFVATFLAQGRELRFPPRAFMSSAQILTDSTRTVLEDATGAKIFDKYGAREFSGIAYQCEVGTDYHVMDESYVVEILKDGKPARPGETGEVVITDLNNYSTPMIRYRIGDLAKAVNHETPCACGRSLSRIGPIQGRTQALVFCENGRWLPGTFFAHFFKDYPHLVTQFQIIQREKAEFSLRVIKGAQWSEPGWQELMAHLRQFVGDTDIRVEFVQEIPLLKTGKRTPVISSVKLDFQEIS